MVEYSDPLYYDVINSSAINVTTGSNAWSAWVQIASSMDTATSSPGAESNGGELYQIYAILLRNAHGGAVYAYFQLGVGLAGSESPLGVWGGTWQTQEGQIFYLPKPIQVSGKTRIVMRGYGVGGAYLFTPTILYMKVA